MKRFELLLAFLALALLLPASSGAQSLTSTAAYAEWNHYTQKRVLTPYHTIIGAPGTTFVVGSNGSNVMSATFEVPLPCLFSHLDIPYPAGSMLRVSIGGFFGFDGAVTNGWWPYMLMRYAPFDHLVFPFWSDFKTSGGAGQGIFYRTDVDSTRHDTTLTIEWSVETMSQPFSAGRFQARLTQVRPDIARPSTWRTAFTFEYDRSNPIDRSTSYGAAIGLKNLGQDATDPGALYDGADNGKFLLLVDPGAILPDNAAITRLPTRERFMPDWFATSSTLAASYFHFGFPDSNYAVMPIIIDVMPDLMPPASRPGGSHFPYLTPADSTMTVVVHNNGMSDQFNVPTEIIITHGPSVVLSDTVMIDTITALGSVSTPQHLPTSATGEYVATVTTKLPGDQNRGNDTVRFTYYVSPARDGAATEILSPVLMEGSGRPRYLAGTPIPISVRLANLGTLASSFIAGYTILDEHDSIVAGRTDSIPLSAIPPMTELGYSFGNYTPAVAGHYRINLTCGAVGDQLPANDLLASMPRREWRSHGTSPSAPGIVPITFDVYPGADLAVQSPPARMPAAGDTIHASTRVMATFVNNGGLDANLVTVSAVIRNAANVMVYSSQRILPAIAGGGGRVMTYFDDFGAAAPGTYCVTVTIASDTSDHLQANNTATWCFTVAPSLGTKRSDGGRLSGGTPAAPAGTRGTSTEQAKPAAPPPAAETGSALPEKERIGLQQRSRQR